MSENNVVFCYSATGNSLALAKRIANELNFELRLISRELVQKKQAAHFNVCVFVFPSYAYGIPKLLKSLILNCDIKADYMAGLVTYGSHYLGTLSEFVKLFKRKKQRVHYVNGAKSVENYVHIFGLMSQDKIQKRLDDQDKKTDLIIADIDKRATIKKCGFAPVSRSISFLFRTFKPLLTKCYRVKKSCNGCAMCARVCPTNAIEMRDNKPKFKARACDHCQACLQLCPNKAIAFMRVNSKSRRYIHRDIKPNELFKR